MFVATGVERFVFLLRVCGREFLLLWVQGAFMWMLRRRGVARQKIARPCSSSKRISAKTNAPDPQQQKARAHLQQQKANTRTAPEACIACSDPTRLCRSLSSGGLA